MAALTDLNDIINRLTGGAGAVEHLPVHYTSNLASTGSASSAAVSGINSLFMHQGTPGGENTTPAANVTLWGSNSNAGMTAGCTWQRKGVLGQTDPAGGAEKWLLGFEAWCSNGGGLTLYDRLGHTAAFLPTSSQSNTAIGGGTLTAPRYNDTSAKDGVGTAIFVEAWTTMGSGNGNFAVNYLDESGVAQVSQNIVLSGLPVGRMLRVPLAPGSRGVTAITGYTTASSSIPSTGALSVVLARPLLYTGGQSNTLWQRDAISGIPTLPQIKPGAALTFLHLSAGNTSPTVMGAVHTVDK